MERVVISLFISLRGSVILLLTRRSAVLAPAQQGKHTEYGVPGASLRSRA